MPSSSKSSLKIISPWPGRKSSVGDGSIVSASWGVFVGGNHTIVAVELGVVVGESVSIGVGSDVVHATTKIKPRNRTNRLMSPLPVFH